MIDEFGRSWRVLLKDWFFRRKPVGRCGHCSKLEYLVFGTTPYWFEKTSLCRDCYNLYMEGYEQLRKDILEKRVFIEGFWKV